MILRAIHVENWRSIRRLDLDELPDGVIVLFGPNRTGKSSLALAIRCCLFDFDHDASGREIKNAIPWNGGGPPKVVVEFAAGGVDYRLTKVFSKRKEGMAKLEKKVAGAWQVEQDAPKEASRRVRELLGADKSSAGLNQLLWLDQGTTVLPEQKDIDISLQQKLAGVLGMMVTGPDLRFKHLLDTRYAKWFTAQTGKYKESCLVRQWEDRKQERLKSRDDERVKLDQCDAAIRQLQQCEDELPATKKATAEAGADVEKLRDERERGKERFRLHQAAEQAMRTAAQWVGHAEQALASYEAIRQRYQQEEANAVLARNKVEETQRRKDDLVAAYGKQLGALEAARLAEAEHQRLREGLEDRRKLLTIAQRRAQLEQLNQAIRCHKEEIAKLQARLADIRAPDEKAVIALRDNRTRARNLRAELKASALAVAVTLDEPRALELSIDGQAAAPIHCAAGAKQIWPLRQWALIRIPEVGTVEVGRAQQNLDLERMVGDLADLDRDYEEEVRSYQEKPAHEACLDRLAERRIQKASDAVQLQQAQAKLLQVAPAGPAAFDAELEELGRQYGMIVERRPTLASWEPRADDVEELEKHFKNRGADLEAERKAAEAMENAGRVKVQAADAELHEQKESLSGSVATANRSKEALVELGEESVLREKIAEATRAAADAQRALADNELTEAEKTIDQRLGTAETAAQEQIRKLRALEERLQELRGVLKGTEGLHTRLADAEAAVEEAETALAREKLEAEAHRRVRNLFDECRENQVQQVMGPIASRVLEWSRQIGLDDFQEVRFGDAFLPEGIVVRSAGPDKPILMAEESHGTEEQLSILVRLALGGVLARDEPAVAIFDDPLAHADRIKHARILDVLRLAAAGGSTWVPPAGKLQIIILTCHPERFACLSGAHQIDLQQKLARGPARVD